MFLPSTPCPAIKKKFQDIPKSENHRRNRASQTSEADSYKEVMLELSDWDLKKNMISMLRALMEEVDSMQ